MAFLLQCSCVVCMKIIYLKTAYENDSRKIISIKCIAFIVQVNVVPRLVIASFCYSTYLFICWIKFMTNHCFIFHAHGFLISLNLGICWIKFALTIAPHPMLLRGHHWWQYISQHSRQDVFDWHHPTPVSMSGVLSPLQQCSIWEWMCIMGNQGLFHLLQLSL